MRAVSLSSPRSSCPACLMDNAMFVPPFMRDCQSSHTKQPSLQSHPIPDTEDLSLVLRMTCPKDSNGHPSPALQMARGQVLCTPAHPGGP